MNVFEECISCLVIQCNTSDNELSSMFSTENMDCILNLFLHRQFHVIKVIYVIKVKY